MPSPRTEAVRLRQVALITADLAGVTGRLEQELGLLDAYRDEGVGRFGLENRVLAAGDCFVEVLTPLEGDSSGRRYLERRGKDGGYMAIFQFGDRHEPRRRARDELGLNVAWQIDLDDVSTTHLDPREVPGAIVSLDWAAPPDSWRWGGPSWQGGSPPLERRRTGGITSLTVAVADPGTVAARWQSVLGPGARLEAPEPVGASPEVTIVRLPAAGQSIRFVARDADPATAGIVECGLALGPPPQPQPLADEPTSGERVAEIGGVRFVLTTHPRPKGAS